MYSAGKVAILIYCQVPFSLLWDILLGHWPTFWSLGGSAVILTAALMTMTSKVTDEDKYKTEPVYDEEKY